jgi:4-amino-4-deoxy-L-arabinose transferase-like glycosyltransferase
MSVAVNQPTPAIVAQSAVQRLPRAIVFVLCLAYILPGFVGREPWKADDIASFGFMLALTEGDALSWLRPDWLEHTDWDRGPLTFWLGSKFMALGPPDAWPLLARLPFMLLLGMTFASTWYATYALAREPSALPVRFAFGGEARPADYARALADGAVLALMASLGLARLSHEITPAVGQLAFGSLLFFGVAVIDRQRWAGLTALGLGAIGMTLSGAPTFAVMLGGGGLLLQALRNGTTPRPRMRDIGLGCLLLLIALVLAGSLDLWQWQVQFRDFSGWDSWLRMVLWFTWPGWPLAVWTLWRWRAQVLEPQHHLHLAWPLWFTLVPLLGSSLSPMGDKALLPALPAMAVLAAFALPTLGRSVAALIDWFTLLFFSACALIIWTIWLAMHTGWPVKPAANVARLAPGFEPTLSWGLTAIALVTTLCWLVLVRWRVGRHRSALWKSLALPAGGAILCWMLLMTLWLPLLDFGRSYAPLAARVRAVTGPGDCLQQTGLTSAQAAGLRWHGRYRLQAAGLAREDCPWLVVDAASLTERLPSWLKQGWILHTTLRRPSSKDEDIALLRAVP